MSVRAITVRREEWQLTLRTCVVRVGAIDVSFGNLRGSFKLPVWRIAILNEFMVRQSNLTVVVKHCVETNGRFEMALAKPVQNQNNMGGTVHR